MNIFTRLFLRLLGLLLGLLLAGTAQAQKMRDTKYEHGLLEQGRKVGVWEYYGYTPSGERVVVQRYDHDQRRLLYFRPGAEITVRAEVQPGEWRYVRVDQPPLFVGSEAALAAFTTRLNYPPLAIARNIQGKVVVGFLIDTLGQATGYKVVRGIGGGCDEEALRVARTVPADQWLPARIGRRAVAVEYELPLNFRLAQ